MERRATFGFARSTLLWFAVGTGLVAAAIWYRELLGSAFASNPTAGSVQSVERGTALWKANCEACHGAQGRGDGPATAALYKKPKDLTRIARPPVFPDGVLAYRIASGGEVMPAWKGVLSESDIWDLVSYIRAQRR
jgi:mono/diheme cytochrome c family protein